MKIVSLILIVLIIANPIFSMPVPSKPVEKEPTSAQSGGFSSVFGIAVFICFAIPIIGLCMVFDGREDNDSGGTLCLALFLGMLMN